MIRTQILENNQEFTTGEIAVDGKAIAFTAFSSLNDARAYRESQSTIYFGLVLGDLKHPKGRYWVCGLGDAVRLDGAGYRLIH
jgi:hypothetical protein